MVEPKTAVAPHCNRVQPGATVPRLALTPEEAARALGVGRTLFYERIMPDMRVIYVGRRRLIPMKELERWVDEKATRVVA